MAFFGLEPWGCEREDLRSATIASVIANAHRDSKQHPEGFTPLDFVIPTESGEVEEVREALRLERKMERLKAAAQQIRMAFQATQERKREKVATPEPSPAPTPTTGT